MTIATWFLVIATVVVNLLILRVTNKRMLEANKLTLKQLDAQFCPSLYLADVGYKIKTPDIIDVTFFFKNYGLQAASDITQSISISKERAYSPVITILPIEGICPPQDQISVKKKVSKKNLEDGLLFAHIFICYSSLRKFEEINEVCYLMGNIRLLPEGLFHNLEWRE